jgi:ParB family chromosome partitioning protein
MSEPTSTEAPSSAAFDPAFPLAGLVEASWNPRRHHDKAALAELAESIKQRGVLEPILIRPKGKKHEIVAGSRRFRAAGLAGLETIPALVSQLSDIDALEAAIIENGQRVDIHPLDEAQGFHALIEADPKRFTPAIVAGRVGKSETYVQRRLRLLSLEAPIRKALMEDRLSLAHAMRLLRLSPEHRAKAVDPHEGVVWREPMMFEEEGRAWIPRAEDLLPLWELDRFIQEKATVDLSAPGAVHIQPGLAEAIRPAVEDLFEGAVGPPIEYETASAGTRAEAEAEVLSALVAVSEDPMVRAKIGAGKNEPVPLTPSKWREVKPGSKHACEFARAGAVVHGGPFRLLTVCTKRSCAVHFPAPKKKPAAKAAATAAPRESDWEREQRRREDRDALFDAVRAAAAPKLLEKARAKVTKVTAALVRAVTSRWAIEEVKKAYGVELTDKTAMVMLFLVGLPKHDEREYRKAARSVGLNIDPIVAQVKKDRAAAKKAAAKASA